MYRNSTTFRSRHRACLIKIQRIMKLTFPLLLLAMVHVSASTHAQRLTLKAKQISLSTLFKEVRKQTGYNVLWSSPKLNAAKKIRADFNNSPLEDVLNSCLENSGLEFSFQDKTILITEKNVPDLVDRIADAMESITIKGVIVDENNKPLSGATIKVLGTNQSVIADQHGEFVLSGVDEKATVQVSFVGYKTLVTAAAKLPATVKMVPTATKLDEVKVNTGYGIVRNKRELGYTTATVSGEELNKGNNGNLLSGLAGKISGLNITQTSDAMTPQFRILLRGIRSFGSTSNNQPLFVFNGAPLSFGSGNEAASRAAEFINSLNPADIEDVTVLKGANGTAMYGPEGVNGVIIITTKKAKAGQVITNFRSSTSVSAIDFKPLYNVQDKFGLGSNGALAGTNTVYSWGPAYDGSLIAIGYPDENGKYQMVKYAPTRDKYQFFNKQVVNRTNLSLSAGDDNASYYLGLGHIEKRGYLPGDKAKQTTLTFNSAKNFGKNVNILFNTNLSQDAANKGQDVTANVLYLPSFIPLLSYKDWQNGHWANLDNYWYGQNPYMTLATSRTKTTTNALASSLTTNVKILPWLSVKDITGINFSGFISKQTIAGKFYDDYARVNPLKTVDSYPSMSNFNYSQLSLNNDFLITAIHQTQNFLFRVNLGSNIRQSTFNRDLTSATLVIPVYDFAYQKDNSLFTDELHTLERSYSYFGNINIGYKNLFFAEFTARDEWDSRRAKVAQGKDLYAGVNTSFVLKEAIPLLKRQKWLSSLRLRASVASTANMNIEPYASETTLFLAGGFPYSNVTTGPFGIVTGSTYLLGYGLAKGIGNPNIKPERVFSQEYGTEIGLLNNRIKLDANYYTQVNTGVIMTVDNAWLSGSPAIQNAGSLRNSGFEFDLGLTPLVNLGPDFRINLQTRLALNYNKVLKVAEQYDGVFPVFDPQSGTFYIRTGHSAFEYQVFDWKRDPNGRVIVDKNSGLPSVDIEHPKILGKTLPTIIGGFTLNIEYKRFSLSGQADYSGGNQHLFATTNISAGLDRITVLNNREKFVFPNSSIEVSPGVYKNNTDVSVSNTGQQLYSLFSQVNLNNLVSSDYWKLSQLSLQYLFKVNKSFVKSFTVGFYGNNLLTLYPKGNLLGDPTKSDGPGVKPAPNAASGSGAAPSSASNNLTGSVSGQNTLPGSKTYGFVLNVTF